MSAGEKTVMVLCGGLGTRLRSVVPDLPKILVSIGDVAFLDLLLNYLSKQGIEQVYLALGYKSELVISYLSENKERFKESFKVLSIDYFVEPEPLGTAGAVTFALKNMRGLPDQLIVMNGDTFINADLPNLLNQNKQQKSEMTMVVVAVEDRSRFGALQIENSLVNGFLEKGGSAEPGMVNGGVYCFKSALLEKLKCSDAKSLETDVFPELASSGGIGALIHSGAFLDYGTPEGLKAATEEAETLVQKMNEREEIVQ